MENNDGWVDVDRCEEMVTSTGIIAKSSLKRRTRKMSWKVPLAMPARTESRYRLMPASDDESYETSSDDEVFDRTYTIEKAVTEKKSFPQSSTFDDISSDILGNEVNTFAFFTKQNVSIYLFIKGGPKNSLFEKLTLP